MATPNSTLETLLEQVATKDRAAFCQLYEHSFSIVFGVLLQILPRRDIAEEALQDVYVKVWRQAASYRPSRGKALAWLTSIARHRALDIRRSLHRETTLPAEYSDGEPQPLTATNDPELAAQWGDDAQRLKDCMQALSSDQSGSIRLAFLRGYSHSEVSQAVGAPIGTVKSWIRRGLGALKRCLSQ